MNLPFVFDIVIGLIFIYLIFSLLASEIQELLATLLQWRAIHLKKSIEILLSGGEDTDEEQKVKDIVDNLYNNPLIRTINHESKDGIEGWLRQVTWQVGRVYRALRNKETTEFGKDHRTGKNKHSAPGYIPAETFSTMLLEQLNITKLSQKISLVNLIHFKDQEIISEIENTILAQLQVSESTHSGLLSEFQKLETNIDNIFINFKADKLTLLSSVKRIENEIDKYIDNSKDYFAEDESNSKKQFLAEMTYYRQAIFSNPEELIRRLKPGLTEVVDALETGGKLYQNTKESLQNKDSEIYKAYQEIADEVQQVIERLPASVRDSLATIARRVQIKAGKTEAELSEFKREIEVWFDRSMDRASGVYKRNAKGVAFLIGLFLAFAANADTLHIASRLSKDTPLREAITQNAAQVISDPSCPDFNNSSQELPQSSGTNPSKLDCIRNQVNQTLEKVTLPIGRNTDNIEQQKAESKDWFFPPLRRILGWIISGLAISMGAPFWFELLSKFINVRNTGPKPTSSTQDK